MAGRDPLNYKGERWEGQLNYEGVSIGGRGIVVPLSQDQPRAETVEAKVIAGKIFKFNTINMTFFSEKVKKGQFYQLSLSILYLRFYCIILLI